MKYMEKKNMVLLTVIAVATLLVAVVGATFAYFTATSETGGNETTTEVTTRQVAGLSWTEGDAKGASPAVYPGYKAYQSYELEATGSGTANFSLTLNGTVPSTLTDAVTYTIYRTTTEPTYADAWTAGDELVAAEGAETRYSITGAQFDHEAVDMTQVATGKLTQGDSVITTNEQITAGTKYYYVLVLDYANANASQNTQQGQTFAAKLTLKALPTA